MLFKKYLLFTYVFLLFSCSNQDVKVVKSNNHIEFTNHNNQSVKIKTTKKSKLFFALDAECPLCQSYSQKIDELFKKYNKEIDFYAFFPSKIFIEKKVNDFIEKYKLDKLNIIIDTNLIITHFFDAEVTPECFLINNDLEIIYHGAIDDQVQKLGRKRDKANQEYLNDAIYSHINNKPIIIKKTNAIGCFIEKK